MNTINNKRRKDSQLKIENVFLELIQTKEIEDITVSDICKFAKINRSTFYSNYLDIYDLADKIGLALEEEVASLYDDQIFKVEKEYDFLRLLNHIKDNQIFYKTYFKLNFDNKMVTKYDKIAAKIYYNDNMIDYHIAFFRAGFNAVIKKWLYSGCKETPEQIKNIIESEYKK